MSRTQYTPGVGNAPFGNQNANPESSNYQSESGYGATGSNLLAKEIRRVIFDAAPEQYKALRLIFEKSAIEKNLDEFEYLEKTFGRNPAVANAISGSVAAVPGSAVTQNVTMTAASIGYLSVDLVLTYPNNAKGIIKAINTATNVVTIESLTSQGLPAVASGDVFSIAAAITGDGVDYFSNYSRMNTITRYNYIQLFLRACRWTRLEEQKHINAGNTNYMALDKGEKLEQLRTDLFVSFFNGTRGEFALANNNLPAKAMGGIYPSMVAAGSWSANPTTAGLRNAFETGAFATNFKKEGSVRMIYGTEEMLYTLSKVFKDPGTRYAPNDRIADLNLYEYRLGTQRFVPVTCELFRERSCFPAAWAKRLLILDQETISPVKMKGIPMIEMGSTLNKGANGTREDYKDWWVGGNLSLEFNNPLASFILDVQ